MEYFNLDNLVIRQECEADYSEIRNLVETAFLSAQHSDGYEQDLVERIRNTKEYLPSLTFVAVYDGRLVGHLMMSKIYIDGNEAVAIAPLSVLPDFQKKGVGSALIERAHSEAEKHGYNCSVVLGSPDYYSKFGYREASVYGIYPPFDVPLHYYMVYPFKASAVPNGMVHYSNAFGI